MRRYGFIDCDDCEFGHDVYIDDTQFNGHKVGENVAFQMYFNRGRPQARDVRSVTAQHGAPVDCMPKPKIVGSNKVRCNHDLERKIRTEHETPKGPSLMHNDLPKPVSVDSIVALRSTSSSQNSVNDPDCVRPTTTRSKKEKSLPRGRDKPQMTGTIKSFNEKLGYGFIECDCDQYGRDVFLHKKHMASLEIDDRVVFRVNIKGDKPQAFDVSRLPDPVFPEGARPTSKFPQVCTSCGFESKEDIKKSKKEYVGRVKSFSSMSGYGFIECDDGDFDRDVFVHVAQLNDVPVDGRVAFQVRLKDQKPQAHHVRLAQDSDTSTSSQSMLCRVCLSKKLLRACASARSESTEDVRKLLGQGANPNALDITSYSALMVAALNGRNSEHKCRLLIEHRADVHTVCAQGMSVLEWARNRVSPSFGDFLLAVDKGEPVDAKITFEPLDVDE